MSIEVQLHNTTTTADKDLLVGDVAAFHQLFRNYAPPILGLLVKMVGEDQAELLLPAVFFEIKNRKSEYEKSGLSLFTWMFQVARSNVLSAGRQKDSISEIRNTIVSVNSKGGLLESVSVNHLFEGISVFSDITVFELINHKGVSPNAIAGYLKIEVSEVYKMLRSAINHLKTVQHEQR